MSTCLGHRLPGHLVKHYFGCVYKEVSGWDWRLNRSIEWSTLQSPVWVELLQSLVAGIEQKGWEKDLRSVPDCLQSGTLVSTSLRTRTATGLYLHPWLPWLSGLQARSGTALLALLSLQLSEGRSWNFYNHTSQFLIIPCWYTIIYKFYKLYFFPCVGLWFPNVCYSRSHSVGHAKGFSGFPYGRGSPQSRPVHIFNTACPYCQISHQHGWDSFTPPRTRFESFLWSIPPQISIPYNFRCWQLEGWECFCLHWPDF